MLKRTLKKFLDIFRIYKDERWPALLALAYFGMLNTINVWAYWEKFSVISDHYHKLYVNDYNVSGFDPLTYEVLSSWFPAYDVHRHPLLAFFIWPLSMLNQGIIYTTGTNYAIIITALLLVFCSVYSFLFLFRILNKVIGLSRTMTLSLTAVYFSMGFIMLSSMVPDHFVMSQFCLLMTLWLAGEKLKNGSALNMWQTIALFLLTAGVSLNNGLKIFLAGLVTRRKRFFEWRYILFACILPATLIWGIARWEYKTYRWPREMARLELKMKKEKVATERLRQRIADTISDKSKIDATLKTEQQRLAEERKHRKEHSAMSKKTGKPIAKGEFMRWTDITTNRMTTGIENLFGEAIQLHREHALEDVLKKRPLFVYYSAPWKHVNYAVEGCLFLLFVLGIWCGIRSLLMWTALSMFAMDMVLHLGLGFGINEIYIMSAHYMFAFPIAMAFFAKRVEKSKVGRNTSLLLFSPLALWLLTWNVSIIINYFYE